jgi:DNA-binding PadR family transcriptional regulator
MKTLWYYVLLSLGDEDRHGQAIAREIAELSGGQVSVWPAGLYGAFVELESRGWIEELTDKRRPADESQRRRYYRLTAAGRTALTSETDRLATVVRIARGRVRARRRET